MVLETIAFPNSLRGLNSSRVPQALGLLGTVVLFQAKVLPVALERGVVDFPRIADIQS